MFINDSVAVDRVDIYKGDQDEQERTRWRISWSLRHYTGSSRRICKRILRSRDKQVKQWWAKQKHLRRSKPHQHWKTS